MIGCGERKNAFDVLKRSFITPDLACAVVGTKMPCAFRSLFRRFWHISSFGRFLSLTTIPPHCFQTSITSSLQPQLPTHAPPTRPPPPSLRPLLPRGNQLPHNEILIRKPLVPPIQILDLIGIQIPTVIQRPLQILREHVLVETLAREPPRRIPAGEVLVGPTGPVEVAAGADVEDLAADGEVDGLAVVAVVREEGARGEGAEDDRGWAFGEGGGGLGSEAEVDEEEEEGGEEEGYGGGYCCAGG